MARLPAEPPRKEESSARPACRSVSMRNRRSSAPAYPAPFFFQAEDGIRDADVTGVQTCALPILAPAGCPLADLVDRRVPLTWGETLPLLVQLGEDRKSGGEGKSAESRGRGAPGRKRRRPTGSHTGTRCRARWSARLGRSWSGSSA